MRLSMEQKVIRTAGQVNEKSKSRSGKKILMLEHTRRLQTKEFLHSAIRHQRSKKSIDKKNSCCSQLNCLIIKMIRLRILSIEDAIVRILRLTMLIGVIEIALLAFYQTIETLTGIYVFLATI